MSNNGFQGEDRSINVGQDINSSTLISGDSNIGVHGDRAIITITNYYYYDTKVVTVESTDTASDENQPCPYRGLFHFGPDDAEFFFGREVFVKELFEATQNRNFIPVLGASGSGKSSVVLAGLVPKLQQAGQWLFTHFRPGRDPFHALAESLVPLYEPDKNKTEQMHQARQLAEYFFNRSVPLRDVFSQIERNYPNHRVLLIADQFEELYTLCPDPTTRHSFLDTLLASVQFDSSNSNVLVATLRADFLGNALSYPQFGDVLRNADVKIRSMNREELSEVIVKPAEKVEVTFQDGLVKRILDHVEDAPGNLPLLEFALTELWKRRTGKQLTHAAYDEIGEVTGALARHADGNYRKLSAIKQEQMRRIFMQLVCLGEGTEDTRRIATKSELGEAIWLSVSQLADARLVVTSRNSSGQETVEIVHEALLRHWQLLRSWIDENRSKIIQKNKIERLATEWRDNKHLNDYLLQGKQLNEAIAFPKEQASLFTLSDLARDFIQASIKQRQNKNAIVLGMILSSMVGVSILVNKEIIPLIQVRQLWEEFNTAKKQNNIPKIKLVIGKLVEAKQNLDKINLSYYQLGGANFSNTILTDAIFSHTILGRAIFNRADLTGAIFNDANLGNASFDNATLNNAKLINAILGGATLTEAKLRTANLSNADLSGAELGGADLSNANLNGAKFNYANLGRVKLNGAELQKANFENAQNLKPEQVKQAKDWQQAKYSKEFWYQLNKESKKFRGR